MGKPHKKSEHLHAPTLPEVKKNVEDVLQGSTGSSSESVEPRVVRRTTSVSESSKGYTHWQYFFAILALGTAVYFGLQTRNNKLGKQVRVDQSHGKATIQWRRQHHSTGFYRG